MENIRFCLLSLYFINNISGKIETISHTINIAYQFLFCEFTLNMHDKTCIILLKEVAGISVVKLQEQSSYVHIFVFLNVIN